MTTDRSRTAVFRGFFNPPHLGHIEAVRTVHERLNPDRIVIIPSSIDTDDEEAYPSPEERLELCRLAFSVIPNTFVSALDIESGGKSYPAITLETIKNLYPDDELCWVIGADEFLEVDAEYLFSRISELCTITVLARTDDDLDALHAKAGDLAELHNATCEIINHDPLHIHSAMVRSRLPMRLGREQLSEPVYAAIIRNRFYNAEPELSWLREQVLPLLKPSRVAHVTGCENEAVSLAMQYGENTEVAAEAAILHDITKAFTPEKHMELCSKYAIELDEAQKRNPSLLHAITGAALSKDMFGISDEVYNAIRWHTTGKADMTLLEKIIYMADYIEPNRDFPAVEDLRTAAAKNLDKALAIGLQMSLEDIRARGLEPHIDTITAENWYNNEGENENDDI